MSKKSPNPHRHAVTTAKIKERQTMNVNFVTGVTRLRFTSYWHCLLACGHLQDFSGHHQPKHLTCKTCKQSTPLKTHA